MNSLDTLAEYLAALAYELTARGCEQRATIVRATGRAALAAIATELEQVQALKQRIADLAKPREEAP